MEELKIHGMDRMHYLVLLNMVMGPIIRIVVTHCPPLVYTCEDVITVCASGKARRARIRLPIARIRNLKVSPVKGVLEQVMIELRPEPAV